MFSNTAYEALYEMIGLRLHSQFITLITSEGFFKGLILLIFGALFFISVVKFISRYVPGSLIERKHIPPSQFVKIIACLFLGLALLRVGGLASVHDYKGQNWSDNSYIRSHLGEVDSEYRVSLIYQIIARTAEELTALLSKTIDGVMSKGESQLTAPNFFYKAIMYSGLSTVEDPKVKETLGFYTDECFSKVIPSIGKEEERGALDRFFNPDGGTDADLQAIELELPNGEKSDCLQVKNEARQQLHEYATSQPNSGLYLPNNSAVGSTEYKNLAVSSYLVNFYHSKSESLVLGIQKGAETPGVMGSIFRNMNRLLSWNGLMGIFSGKEALGASEAAERSLEFGEHLARAPHVAGFIKMVLIFIFPWLMFFVVAGKWRVLLLWFWIYFSVLLWTPLWTLLYHIMLGISLSGEVMESFGTLNDGISLYSSAVITSRMYYMFSIYSWAQLLIATLTTGSVFVFIRPMLGHSQSESAPEFLGTAQGGIGMVRDNLPKASAASSAASTAAAVL